VDSRVRRYGQRNSPLFWTVPTLQLRSSTHAASRCALFYWHAEQAAEGSGEAEPMEHAKNYTAAIRAM
jgi:hypothetical protein